MPKLTARLSDYERDTLLLATAALALGVYQRVLPHGISTPEAHLAKDIVRDLFQSVEDREEAQTGAKQVPLT